MMQTRDAFSGVLGVFGAIGAGAILLAALVLFDSAATRVHHADVQRGRATLTARTLADAVRTYRERHGAWPAELLDLTKRVNGRPAVIDGDHHRVEDPWGQSYQFRVVRTEDGGETVYVWTERTAGGTTEVYGSKPPAGK